jgi:hypothetical protein
LSLLLLLPVPLRCACCFAALQVSPHPQRVVPVQLIMQQQRQQHGLTHLSGQLRKPQRRAGENSNPYKYLLLWLLHCT